METLALFARQPQPSRTKTRLAKSVGDASLEAIRNQPAYISAFDLS